MRLGTTTVATHPTPSAPFFSLFAEDKAAGAVVDAISVAQLVIKKKEAFEKVEEDNQARVNFSRNRGMQNCKPGPFSTAFPSPPLRAGRGGGTRPSGGGSSGATGASGGGSSRKVKPMDADITSKMEAFVDGGNIVWDDDDIIAFSKATGRDLKLSSRMGGLETTSSGTWLSR